MQHEFNLSWLNYKKRKKESSMLRLFFSVPKHRYEIQIIDLIVSIETQLMLYARIAFKSLGILFKNTLVLENSTLSYFSKALT